MPERLAAPSAARSHVGSHLRLRALTTALAIAAGGCSTILAVREQQQKFDANAVIGGNVQMAGRDARGPLVVGIAAKGPGGYHLVDHFVTEKGGSWVVAVEPGTYWVMAFEDADADGRYDDEPAWRPDEKDSIDLVSGERRLGVHLQIPEDGRFANSAFSLEEARLRGREEQQRFSLFALSVPSSCIKMRSDPARVPVFNG